MAQFIPIAVIAAAIFGICYLVDKGFAKVFRSKAQHHSGLAVRASKRYGVFGVILTVLGIAAVTVGITDGPVLLWGGVIVLLIGACLAVYYLSFGIFYDGESFLLSSFGKKDVTHFYRDIREQKLYLIQGGSVVIELHMEDGTAVSVNTGMDGVYPFLDTAFAGWCLQKGIAPESCDFHDPSRSWWFPHEEDV